MQNLSNSLSRKERVYFKLKELSAALSRNEITSSERIGFETRYVAQQLNINRNNASKELNVLVKEGKVIKILGKPVLYMDKEYIEKKLNIRIKNPIIKNFGDIVNKKSVASKGSKHSDGSLYNKSINNIFDNLIGSNESLRSQVKQAKAAILYPPKGLHTLLIGPTGVGKTTFAEVMYRYAIEKGRLNGNSPYVVFNCADYAENPQLLLSHLFGHSKGAFTGADTDKKGLIDKSNGGILFLDEVHRLPAEGQEMLFSIMDRGTYNRLGESENTRRADVLIIAATTENPESVMLNTFLRRIQVVIKLPSLENRTLRERMDFICQFFSEESIKIKAPVKIPKEVLKILLLYKCSGNIGQLKNDIKLICANAFLDYITENKDYVEVKVSQLSDRFKDGLFSIDNKRYELAQNFNLNDFGNIVFEGKNDKSNAKINNIFVYDDYKIKDDLYETMLQNAQKFYESGMPTSEIKQNMNKKIKEYFTNNQGNNMSEKVTLKKEILSKIVTPEIVDIVQKSFEENDYKFDGADSKIIYSLALHIETLLERINLNQIVIYPNIEKAYSEHEKEYGVAVTIKKKLEEKFSVEIPEDEIAFITMFIYWVNESRAKGNIQVLVIAHGYGTATNMVEVTKTLLGYNCIHALDMPLEEKVEVILEKAIQTVKKIDKGKGVLLLVDMGSLTTFSDIITNKTGIPTKYVKMVSTPMVIEAARKAMEPNMNLDVLVDSVKNMSQLIGERVKIDNPPVQIDNFKIGYHDRTINMLEGMLTFLDVKKVSEVMDKVIRNIAQDIHKNVDDILYIKFLFHCSCMIERVIRNYPLPYKNVLSIKNENRNLFSVVKSRFSLVEEVFGIQVPDSEFAYIVEMLNSGFN
ncbi:MAG: sigma 54-interacting transcriptional regulator [Clostridium sp.]|jgi:transcriptional regulator with AAA-type ATPase domain/transcriptional regulatory protein LevR|uniref:sigma-54-dependent transcriptional regulator n=1 Tax=Clostridium sp. TaxID=1506 RepID=UPI0025C689C9|nr:sigma-54-dependent transcriptional regulator [Clostridium sp.]MCH3965817.1 sigma 54-interacting transcriptional regulator [Clostridium sp.]MCI1716094.1 sigma 54-interacting transcriptional regulator [Clostridium sp.]MCI1800234.1 sigma 54-interacting transcriptional regulator [Clostridium sp.]MCI1814271.1 sigma 54-interacting transcriptional regulator [Clostridium sp.]MCI1871170.1 sigma 54-interacting transcriptional regulator [Clostridium sp.]